MSLVPIKSLPVNALFVLYYSETHQEQLAIKLSDTKIGFINKYGIFLKSFTMVETDHDALVTQVRLDNFKYSKIENKT